MIVADGLVMSPMRTGGLSFCSPAVPAVFVNVCISHSAALPLWFAGGVVAVTSIRAQPTLFVGEARAGRELDVDGPWLPG